MKSKMGTEERSIYLMLALLGKLNLTKTKAKATHITFTDLILVILLELNKQHGHTFNVY